MATQALTRAGKDFRRIAAGERLANGVNFGPSPSVAISPNGTALLAQIGAAYVDGSPANPNAAALYANPVLYVERTTASTPDAAGNKGAPFANWSNPYLEAPAVFEVLLAAGSCNAVGAINARVQSNVGAGTVPSDVPAGQVPGCNVISTGNFGAFTNAPNGSNNRQTWSTNFCTGESGSGATGVNVVGNENDIINDAHDATGFGPGVKDNYTAYWAQAASSLGNYATCAFLATAAGSAGGWQFGGFLSANFRSWSLYLNNALNAANAGGIVCGIARANADTYALLVQANGNKALAVTGDPQNPVSLTVNGTYSPFQAIAPTWTNFHSFTAGVGIATLPTSTWGLDSFKNGQFAIASGQMLHFPSGAGMILLSNASIGGATLALLAGSAVTIVSSVGGNFDATSSPSAGRIGLYYDSSTSTYAMKSNVAAAHVLSCLSFKTNSA